MEVAPAAPVAAVERLEATEARELETCNMSDEIHGWDLGNLRLHQRRTGC